ncbi:DUF937 domain-containing protein [Methylocapsa sp. S129]|uniref:DUF937 domain-containing protein n=1 Tax=Methylocapsa sp. S129 TaxID=1641869 RepID=UPI00131B05AC|nr:DUF937 domain-containing protein [Methylocapsa sp. S129]
MAVDLIGLVSQSVTPQMISQIAGMTGLDQTTAEELVGGAVPSVVASLASAASSPGGAQKIADAVSNADPDLTTKLTSALGSGQSQLLTDGAGKLSALIGGSGLSSLAAALSQHSGATPANAQLAIGAVTHALIGALGQQDPSTWSDGGAIGNLLASQKSAISAAMPADLVKSLSSSGLLQGLGAAGAAMASSAAGAAVTQARAAGASSGFPMWAIVVIVLIILAAIYWFVAMKKDAKPAAQAPITIHYAMGREALAAG